MGFSCYLCRDPFNEKGLTSNKGSGDGHGERPVSATRCGHLFHSDCLKTAFQSQGGNVTAWSTKFCPVCKTALQVTDLIRVHASPYDSPAVEAQRAAVEEIKKLNQTLKIENEDLIKKLEYLYIQNREVQSDANNVRREKEDMVHALEQMRRLNTMQTMEKDVYKREVEKLKNIIVTLTEGLTINNCKQGNGNIGSGQSFMHNDYSEQLQQYAAGLGRDSMIGNVNCNGTSINTGHHPPGFLFPRAIASNNGSESQLSIHGSHTTVMSSPDGESRGVGVIGNRAGHYQNYYMLTEPATNQIELDHNLEKVTEQLIRLTASTTSSTETSVPLNGWNLANGTGTRKKADGGATTSNISSFKESPNDEKDRKQESVELKRESSTSEGGTNDYFDDFSFREDEKEESDSSGKWFEKKSRRRPQSKGDRTKAELLQSDKKLYGLFDCSVCKARWGSSQSFLNTAQTCRYCSTKVHPYNQGPILSRKQLEISKQESAAAKKEQGSNK